MLQKKKWIILCESPHRLSIDGICDMLLTNRGLKTKKEKENFLHPKLEDITSESVGLDKKQLQKAINRIQHAIEKKEQIVVFGDYDVDGITGTAILWETLYSLKARVMPYIPDRVEEGYGLSKTGISNSKSQMPDTKLIVTVDNGIVANEAVDFANQRGIDVIITDHHTIGKTLPKAFAIVHTTKLCGAGVAWLIADSLSHKKTLENLDLVALATVADLVPLTDANRTLVIFGMDALHKTGRVGLFALFEEAQIDQTKIGVYEIGHIIAPRLNAMGRIANAMDSLRLLCTKDTNRARHLAEKLGRTNRERQLLTVTLAEHAIEKVKNQNLRFKNLLFLHDELYEEGVIGLVAGKLVEEFYRPAIVVSKRNGLSKASARSISGFNIIEFIRSNSHLLVNAGGHPMAAGFTVETEKLPLLQEALELLSEQKLHKELLIRNLKIDCELPFSVITQGLYDSLRQLSPFGMANPEPVFMSKNVKVIDMRVVGSDGKHLKLRVSQGENIFDAICFGMGELNDKVKIGNQIDIAYSIDENVWNGNKKLQLKIKDIQVN